MLSTHDVTNLFLHNTYTEHVRQINYHIHRMPQTLRHNHVFVLSNTGMTYAGSA